MFILASVALVLCFLSWLVSRALPRVDRLIALAEVQGLPRTNVKREPMPSDLIAYAQSWGDGWARDGALKAIEESYEKFDSWDAVRATLPTANAPTVEGDDA